MSISTSENRALIKLKLYPSLLLLYGGGISSIASKHYDTLHTLLYEVIVQVPPPFSSLSSPEPVILSVFPEAVIDISILNPSPGEGYIKASRHISEVLREAFREYFPDNRRYIRCFDRFEYILALACFSLNKGWAPMGPFAMGYSSKDSIVQEVELEASNAGENWPLLQAGFFDRALDKFHEVRAGYTQFLASRGISI